MQFIATIRRRLALFAAVVATSLIGLVPLSSQVGATASHYYLALGDSAAFGYQPNGDWSDGYADQLLTKLRQDDQNMSLTNMGCWGETTASFISGGCIGPDNGVPTKVTYANGNQLDTAKAFLQANGNSVKLVTLDIGINDIAYNCFDFSTGELDYACVSQTLPVIHDNLVTILTTLQSVSSSSTKFIIGNTLDPFQNVLPSTILAVQELNQVYDQVASETHVSLADIASTVHFNDYPNGGNPYLCDGSAPLSWVCINGDTHSTTLGYTLIANTFYDTYENI